ncbi:MAG: response regulator [Eubacteriales bacterium]|nr:response regulator [Eubacteriales bacterium]
MKTSNKLGNRLTLVVEIVLTAALCFGMAFSSFVGLSAESSNYATEVMADYNTLSNDYIRSFKILRMEAVEKIKQDLSFDDMLSWLQSRDATFMDAIGEDVYDGFAFTYKGGYAHSWDYGDYTDYDPNTRPWYQVARDAGGEIAVVAPYTTFLSNTAYIQRYDTLRMSIAQRYNDEISFDFDLNVTEINALIADRQTIYGGTVAFLYDQNGYILSSTDPNYYGHNTGTVDMVISRSLSETLLDHEQRSYGMELKAVDGTLRLIYRATGEDGMALALLIPFWEVFQRNFLFVLLLALVLIAIEMLFYHHNQRHLEALEQSREAMGDALRQAESASHAKGDFMSRMSHEIRTPLNAVIGYLDIAQDERSDEEKVSRCLEKSKLASRHLLGIINDVLDISSIESGRMKLAHEDFDLKQLVNALTTLFYAQAKAKGVSFEVHVESLESEWLVGDELRVRQILLNLLSNAVKFTPAGGSITLDIKQVGLGQDKIHLSFEVRDTGIGMSKEYLTRMFQPFEQESAATAKNYGGSGLGLSISNNLVHMMGGSIRVDSEQGKGTTFTVLLAFDAATARETERLATESFASLRALVVDDEEDACEYVKKLLERCGVKCDTVTSGKKALRRVVTRRDSGHLYDLCIVDWNMAEMDGIETAREIRRLCGDDMPIIIATAYDYSAISDVAKLAGVNKIVSKPLFQSTVFDLLVNTFGKYRPAEPKEKQRVDFHGLRLMLAEDNEMNMEIALDILRKAGLEVTPVMNGQEALNAFEASAPGTFDAILMDVQMPVMDGYTATRKIRESNHPQARQIPIIAMTANAFAEDVTAALAAGMNDHVAKPISYDRLFASLSRLTKAHRPE